MTCISKYIHRSTTNHPKTNNRTWICPARATTTPTISESRIISSSPSSPNLHSTLGNTFRAISTASIADFYIHFINLHYYYHIKPKIKHNRVVITSERLQTALRSTSSEISASLGRYCDLTKIPAPIMAICGGFWGIFDYDLYW